MIVRQTRRAGYELATRPGRMARPISDNHSLCKRIVAPEAQPAKPKPLTDEQAELAGEHWEKAMILARTMAKKCPGIRLDWESIAAVGLCDAASRFEPERGNKFWTVAHRRIVGEILDEMRENALLGYRRTRRSTDCDPPRVDSVSIILAREDSRVLTIGSTLAADEPDAGFELESNENFERAIRCLPVQHREIFRLYYRHDLTFVQIGRQLGLCESRISQIHSASIERIRKNLLLLGLAS